MSVRGGLLGISNVSASALGSDDDSFRWLLGFDTDLPAVTVLAAGENGVIPE